jgi:hypothetical protein
MEDLKERNVPRKTPQYPTVVLCHICGNHARITWSPKPGDYIQIVSKRWGDTRALMETANRKKFAAAALRVKKKIAELSLPEPFSQKDTLVEGIASTIKDTPGLYEKLLDRDWCEIITLYMELLRTSKN